MKKKSVIQERKAKTKASANGLRVNKRKTVMVVDDSPTTLMMEEMILSRENGFDVLTATDGQDAINKARTKRPDLIFMDSVMPRMNGFAACRALRADESTRGIPIVIVTTRGEKEMIDLVLENGCAGYITKPVDPVELISLVSRYVGPTQE